MSLRIATESDIPALWPALSASRTFPSREVFEEFWSSGPWRVLIDEKGRAAVLERWREHLDILAIKGVWCAERDLPSVLDDLCAVARQHGYARVMSPLMDREDARPYADAGMVELETIVALRSDLRSVADDEGEHAQGFDLLVGTQPDKEALLSVDEACFPEFWRYGAVSMTAVLSCGRVALATESGQVIGYTWCTIDRGMGTVGRLAVLPQARRRGIGAALLGDAMRYLVRNGADVVSLCTQEDNAESRALYARAGLRELPGRLVFLIQEA